VELDDSELVQRSLAGDKSAFGELVMRHQGIIFIDVLGYVRDPEVAKDLTQDAFIKAYLTLRSLRDCAKFKPWMRRIAYRLCIDWFRSPRRKERAFAQVINNSESDLLVVDSSPSVEETVEKRDRKRIILEVLDSLPAEYRSVVLLRYMEELSYEEISAYLRVPLSTVKWRLHVAVRLLRNKLDRELI